MATENRRRLREPSAQSGPQQTGVRERLADSSGERSVTDVIAEVSSERRLGRPSIRPSAFGIPRHRMVDASIVTTAVERISQEAARKSAPPAPRSEPTSLSHTARMRLHAVPGQPALKADIEELLPLSPGVKSLPRPPRLANLEAAQPTARRFPWMSLTIFAVALGASLPPLMHYSGDRSAPPADHAPSSQLGVDWSALSPARDATRARAHLDHDQLLDEGERALTVGDARAAESAFLKALSFGVDDPSAAFGLARVRLRQGDLRGARGWGEAALHRRPQDARYRSFLDLLRSARRSR